MSEGMGLEAICLAQPYQTMGVVPIMSLLLMNSYKALVSALFSKEEG